MARRWHDESLPATLPFGCCELPPTIIGLVVRLNVNKARVEGRISQIFREVLEPECRAAR